MLTKSLTPVIEVHQVSTPTGFISVLELRENCVIKVVFVNSLR